VANYVNVWIGIPTADHNELNNRRGTEDNVGPAKQFVDGQLDPAVVQNLYVTDDQAGTIRHLWSVILYSTDGPFNAQINDFRQEFPGAQVLGCWLPDGSQLLDENDEVRYVISDRLSNYMPDDPEGTPNPTVRDINLPAGWAPREFV
jgi:hypothetical protein